jgi:hypothetical protein
MSSLRRLICALRGHEDYLHFETNRVYLQCVSCGYESPGWTVEHRRPALRFTARTVNGPSVLKKVA